VGLLGGVTIDHLAIVLIEILRRLFVRIYVGVVLGRVV